MCGIGLLGVIAESRPGRKESLCGFFWKRELLPTYAGTLIRRAKLPTIDRKITNPSSDPSRASLARSGCGINPITLRSRLQIPAMLASEPFGFAAGSSRPSGVV